jgi:hypothetical protein
MSEKVNYPLFPDMNVDAVVLTSVRGPLGNYYPEITVRIQTCLGVIGEDAHNREYKFKAIVNETGDIETIIRDSFKTIYGDFIHFIPC